MVSLVGQASWAKIMSLGGKLTNMYTKLSNKPISPNVCREIG
jgi:hypothetical protein